MKAYLHICLVLLVMLGACSKKKITQNLELVPEFEVIDAYFQELVPGQEGGEVYMILYIEFAEELPIKDLSASYETDKIDLSKSGRMYSGKCPKIYKFSKQNAPRVILHYTMNANKGEMIVENIEVKETLYLP